MATDPMKGPVMFHQWLARLAALFLLSTSAAAQMEVANGPRDGVLKIVSGPNSGGCSGYTFGGTIVMTVPSCIFDEGASRPREGLNVVAGLHNHGNREGRNPKPFDRYFVNRVHVSAELFDQLQSGGYEPNGPGSRSIVFLNIHTHEGAPDFDDNTRGVDALLRSEVFQPGREVRSNRFALFGYSNATRNDAVVFSRCSAVLDRGPWLAADCWGAPGAVGGPLFDLETNAAVGLYFGRYDDGASSFTPFDDRLRTDIAAMLDGQKGGFFELRTFDISPDYFIGVDVWNKCSRTVNVGVHFKDAETDDWVTRGFYVVRPGDLAILPVETRNRVLYWTAYADGDDYYGWRGEHEVRYEGNTLEMIREDAGGNWNDIRLQPSC